jgi:NAD(P)-dependent dehydrogenase (short-subunit alcohol dehydrogenase family)
MDLQAHERTADIDRPMTCEQHADDIAALLKHLKKECFAMSNMLQGKRAAVFGAGGSIGAGVARELAAEGAEVFISGRNGASVEEVKKQIVAAGGKVHAAVVDALDDGAAAGYFDGIVANAGGIDIEFNAIGPRAMDYGNGKHAVDLTVEEYMVALETIVKSTFITARNAARQMIKQRSGVIIGLTGSPARGHVEGATAIGTAFGAIETFLENLALELAPKGVRVVCLRTTANVDSNAIRGTARAMNVAEDQMSAMLANMNFLKTPAKVSDTSRAAALIASDRFRLLTGTVVNSSAGTAMD